MTTDPWLEPAEWAAVRLSLEVAARSVAVSLVPAVLAAVLLSRGRFPGRTLLDALVHLPLVVPPVVVGWGLLMLFGVRGPLGSLLDEWFGVRLVFTTEGAALATAVMSFPLIVRAVRLGLDGVDPGLEAAAGTLGAGPLDRFFAVTLPLVARHTGRRRHRRRAAPRSGAAARPPAPSGAAAAEQPAHAPRDQLGQQQARNRQPERHQREPRGRPLPAGRLRRAVDG